MYTYVFAGRLKSMKYVRFTGNKSLYSLNTFYIILLVITCWININILYYVDDECADISENYLYFLNYEVYNYFALDGKYIHTFKTFYTVIAFYFTIYIIPTVTLWLMRKNL